MEAYLDNAATTPLDPAVFDALKPIFFEKWGNASAIHHRGRQARVLIENSRKTVAQLLNTSPAEIFFTSGATEANNLILQGCVHGHGVKHIITSPIEHHAVLHTAEHLLKTNQIKGLHFVNLLPNGNHNLNHLEELLQQHPRALVSLMHGNNEIGNLAKIKQIAKLCQTYEAYFHSDTVQTVGHFNIDLQNINVHFITGSGHKFHGPQGVGFAYIRHDAIIPPLLYGGAQERNMRGGTENLPGIAGLATALKIALEHRLSHRAHILFIKNHMMRLLKQHIPEVAFNGNSGNLQHSLPTLLNVSLPEADFTEMLLFNLDIAGVMASSGSACTSGSNIGSHVLKALNFNINRGSVRFSFSRMTTLHEIDYAVEVLANLYRKA